MKPSAARLLASRLVQVYRCLARFLGRRTQTSIYEDMEQGAAIGFLAAAFLAVFLSAGSISAAMLVFFLSLGIFAGGVIGAIVWIGSVDLPEDPVLAPPPSQARSKAVRRR